MTREDTATLIKQMYQAFNGGDLDAATTIFAPDFYSHPLGAKGPESIKKAWAAMCVAFPAAHTILNDIVIDDDKIATRTTLKGVPDAGNPASDATVMEIIRIEKGRIVEIWGATNARMTHP
jgi:ketosteroid isomerase-like protein